MDSISILFIFVFGTLIGSFINVIALRLNTGRSFTEGRSGCFNCNTQLKWYELIPIVSYFFLNGKCRTCQSSISKQYPTVEFLSGIIFVMIAWRQFILWQIYGSLEHGLTYSILFFFYYAFIFSLLLVIAIYDVRHKIIPDNLSYTFIFFSVLKLGLFFYFCRGLVLNTPDYFDLSAPFVLFLLFASMWYFSSGRWMGFGDAKLAFGIGALLGFSYGISAIILAFWIGALWGLYLIGRSKLFSNTTNVGFSSEVPFAPFLIMATIIIFFSHIDILGLQNLIGL